MKLRSSHYFILIGLAFLVLAITLQIQLGSHTSQLKPLDPSTTVELYNPQGNSIMGNPHGQITLVEFFDYNCKYCRQLHPKIQELITANPDLRVVYKEFLLFGEPSRLATAAALAAQLQGKYPQLQAALLSATQPLSKAQVLEIAKQTGLDIPQLQADMASDGVQQQLQNNTVLAEKLGIDGAPVFIVTNSRITQQPTITTPQYLLKGSSQAEVALQGLIDQVKKDK